MENLCSDCGRGRRSRRRWGHSRVMTVPYLNRNPQCTKRTSFLNSICSLLIMSSLMALIYLMLEYHCTTCSSKCNMSALTQNLNHIAKNLSIINQSYQTLESKITRFTLELPKIEGQIEVLEAFANTMERGDIEWNPKSHLALPNVDFYFCKPEEGRNVSQKYNKHFKDAIVGRNSLNYCGKNDTL